MKPTFKEFIKSKGHNSIASWLDSSVDSDDVCEIIREYDGIPSDPSSPDPMKEIIALYKKLGYITGILEGMHEQTPFSRQLINKALEVLRG